MISFYLIKGVNTIDLLAQSGIHRNDGVRRTISKSCRPWLGVVAPVKRQDDGGIVSILWLNFLIGVAVPGADISLLDISIDSPTAIAIISSLPISALKVSLNNGHPGTLFTLNLLGTVETLDLLEILI